MNAAGWAAAAAAGIALAFAGCAVTWLARDLRGQRHARPLPPLPGRTRTPAGLPRDGPLLTWEETQAWNAVLREYGPGQPAWPGGKQEGQR